MLSVLLLLALATLTVGQYVRPLVFRPFPDGSLNPYKQRLPNLNLCTYSATAFEKCLFTVAVARNNSIPLAMECLLKKSDEDCIKSVASGTTDMVVLSDHGYKPARKAGLRPYIFAQEDDSSLYIAVAPRNITFIGVQEAPIYFDQSKDRAFHAAAHFNYLIGHDICQFVNKASLSEYIKIVDSSDYVPNPDEILVCPNRIPNEIENFKSCNVEASLPRAVFVRPNLLTRQEHNIRHVFETISHRFGTSSAGFKFFDTFQGHDDVIFKKNTISLDLTPTYRNGVDENVFNELHCHDDEQSHDHRILS